MRTLLIMFSNSIKPKASHLLQGELAEQKALNYLSQQGLQLQERNFRCRSGELDLIMTDKQTLVIVEVRFRKNNHYGSAAESVTVSKQSRIIAATQVYLSRHPTNSAIRFDVIAISGNFEINWIKNAF